MIKRYGDSPRAGQIYRRRPGVYAVLLDKGALLATHQADPLPEYQLPGGGIDRGEHPIAALHREVMEETGLTVAVGQPALINEFHDPMSGFHQVDIFFHCTITAGQINPKWRDPEGIVTQRRFFARDDLELGRIRFKPDSLPTAAWGGEGLLYDPLERLIR